MSEEIKAMREDVREVKAHVIELVRQGAINTQTLIEHERRSTNLEARVTPLEAQHHFVMKSAQAVVVLAGLLGIVRVILELLKSLPRP